MGPQRAPGGPVGIPMGPYRTVASPPEPYLLPRKPRPQPEPVNFFRKSKLHFRRLPSISVGNSTFPKLSSELTLNPWGVPRSIRTDRIWMVTDNRGYQKRPPRPISVFPISLFFRVNPSDQLQAGPQPKSFRGKQGVHNQDDRYAIETATWLQAPKR